MRTMKIKRKILNYALWYNGNKRFHDSWAKTLEEDALENDVLERYTILLSTPRPKSTKIDLNLRKFRNSHIWTGTLDLYRRLHDLLFYHDFGIKMRYWYSSVIAPFLSSMALAQHDLTFFRKVMRVVLPTCLHIWS